MAAVVSTADGSTGGGTPVEGGDILLDNKCSLLSLAPTPCRKVLVLGMGGGCDVVVSCALAEMMRDTSSEGGELEDGCEIHFGNCVSPREMDGHPQVRGQPTSPRTPPVRLRAEMPRRLPPFDP